jgi:hypothetical protein
MYIMYHALHTILCVIEAHARTEVCILVAMARVL